MNRGRLVKFGISMFLIMAVLQFIAFADEFDDRRYSPTQREWIEVYLSYKLKSETDTWQQRVCYTISLNETTGSKYINVNISLASGETEPDERTKKSYIKKAEAVIKDIIQQYNWLKGCEVTVQFISSKSNYISVSFVMQGNRALI